METQQNRQRDTLFLSNPTLHGSIPRAASFSDLPSTCHRRVFYEESKTTDGFVKEYSCEQIFDTNSRIRQIEISTLCKSGNKPQSNDTWRVKFPALKPASLTLANEKNKLSTMQLEESKHLSRSLRSLDINEKENVINRFHNTLGKVFQKPPAIKVEPDSDEDNTKIKPEIFIKNFSSNYQPTINLNDDPEVQEIAKSITETEIINEDGASQSKKKLRPLVPKENFPVPNQSRNRCLKLIFFCFVGVASIIISTVLNEHNAQSIDLNNATLELRKQIFGQESAVDELTHYFHESIQGFNTLVLVGGTGVGKTLTAEIIKFHFPGKYNIFEYFAPLKDVKQRVSNYLSSAHCNLVVLENLKSEDIPDLAEIADYLSKLEGRPCVLVLAVINPQITNKHLIKTMDLDKSLNEVQKAFAKLRVALKTIAFQPLTINNVQRCIIEQARLYNIKLSEKKLNDLTTEVISSNSGCKRVYAKVQLLTST